MEKVTEVYLTMENSEHIVQIDNAFQKCAKLLVEKFSEKGDLEDFNRDSFDLKEEFLDQLEDTFTNSAFFSGKGFLVGQAFENTLFPLCAYNDTVVMRILYPVLFYTLILKNFQKKDTANRRNRRGSKSWGKTGNLLEVAAIDSFSEQGSSPNQTIFEERIINAGQVKVKREDVTKGLAEEVNQLFLHSAVLF